MCKMRCLGYVLVLFITLIVYNKILAYNEYKIGNIVKYNDIEFYVLKDSSSDEDSITLLKAEPLTVDEVNLYGGVGTLNNHVNKYTYDSVGAAYDENGYGGMAYYSSEACGYVNNNYIYSGCTSLYESSDIKYVVDAWAKDLLNVNDIIEYRLAKLNEIDNAVYIYNFIREHNDINFLYWIMDAYNDIEGDAWCVNCGGALFHRGDVFMYGIVVRPVINLKKSAIEKEDKQDNTDIPDENRKDDKKDSKNTSDIKEIVNVPNTLQRISVISIMIGVIIISVSTIVILKLRFRR